MKSTTVNNLPGRWAIPRVILCLKRVVGLSLALEGIEVVKATTVTAVSMGARLLGDWGAEVIHTEHPITGDPSRGWLDFSLSMVT